MQKIDKEYITFIKSNSEKDFSVFMKSIHKVLFTQFGANEFFKEARAETFDDIFSYTIEKLQFKKDSFDEVKGNVVSFAYTIFNRRIRDLLRNKINNIEKERL